MQLKIGMTGVLSHDVVASDLASAWRNDVEVLATPILLWLAELACMRAIDRCLAPGFMTLGYGHEVRHLAPTPLGWTVQIEAKLVAMDDKVLEFEVSASDGKDVVLKGRHTRAIVDRVRFLSRIAEKRAQEGMLQ